jgi:hypothetical protein
MSKTAYPVLFANVQMFLNKMGYGQLGHESTFVHFKKETDATIHASGATSHWPKVITIAEPGCVADGYVGLVYDRNYVMDLFLSVFGQDNIDGFELLAILKPDDDEGSR